MASDPLFILIALLMAGVVAALLFGISAYAKGGETSRKYSNKMMRWRIGLQFVAVLAILLFVYLRGGS